MSPTIVPVASDFLLNPTLFATGFVKLLLVVGSILYALFALLVIRQIQLMRSTIHTSNSVVLIFVGLIHFILSIVVVLYFLGL